MCVALWVSKFLPENTSVASSKVPAMANPMAMPTTKRTL
jgi:hypothetical protein